MARLVGVFVTLVLLMLGASLIVGHFRQQAVLGQLAEMNRGVTNESIEHRSVMPEQAVTVHCVRGRGNWEKVQ